MTVNQTISLLVADDHPVVLFGLCRLLDDESDFTVIGAAESCRQLCEALDNCEPDIVLLDLEMTDTCGIDTLVRVRDRYPHVKVIIFTAHAQEHYVLDALRIGIQGYVAKGVTNDRLCEAIRVVSHGGLYLDPAVADAIQDVRSDVAGVPVSSPESLTTRESTVLQYVASGKRNKEIARELYISERTVKFHISSVLSKLGAKNRTEAVSIAAHQKLINM